MSSNTPIKIYRFGWVNSEGELWEDPEGTLVNLSDYRKLERELAAKNAEAEEWKAQHHALLKASCDRQRVEELEALLQRALDGHHMWRVDANRALEKKYA